MQIVRTGEPIIGVEEKESWPDGRESWVLTTKVPLTDRRGGIIGTMGISHNITERKKAEDSQVTDLQRDALAKTDVDLEHHLYTDAASGKRDDRPGLDACIKALRQGDTLVVWKLDRLGRHLRHLVNLVGDLTKRGIGLKVLAGEGISIDTADGRLVFAIFAGLAEFERELIVERTKAGLDAARARAGGAGTAVQDNTRQDASRRGRNGQAQDHVRRTRHSRQTTLYRQVTPDGGIRPDGEKLLARRAR